MIKSNSGGHALRTQRQARGRTVIQHYGRENAVQHAR